MRDVAFNFGREHRTGKSMEKVLYTSKTRVFRKGELHWSSRQSVCCPSKDWDLPENIELQDSMSESAVESSVPHRKIGYEPYCGDIESAEALEAEAQYLRKLDRRNAS